MFRGVQVEYFPLFISKLTPARFEERVLLMLQAGLKELSMNTCVRHYFHSLLSFSSMQDSVGSTSSFLWSMGITTFLISE